MGIWQYGNISKPRVLGTQEQKKQSITVQQKILDSQSQTYSIIQGKTALDLLKETTSVTTKGEKQNAFVTIINTRAADSSKSEYWSLYVNKKQSMVGAGSYILQNNDIIEWKIEQF